MALQSTGTISINDIYNEMVNGGQYEAGGQRSLGALSTAAGKSAPHEMSEFYGYSASGAAAPTVTKYFVVRNMISRAGRWTNEKVFSGAYMLYEKPNSNKTSLHDYILKSSSEGTPARTSMKSGAVYTSNHGSWLTTVVATKTNGVITCTFPDGGTGTYGTSFYINIVSPYM